MAHMDDSMHLEPSAVKRRSGDHHDFAAPAVVFRLLIPANKVGSIIGKEGSNIKHLREETGARIRVSSGPPGQGHEERIVIVSSPLGSSPAPSEPSAAEKALLALLPQAMETSSPEDASLRLLISGSQVGPLIGKAGAVIKQIRETSEAHVKVLEGEQPEGALHHDRVVHLAGSEAHVRHALDHIILTLRDHLPRESLQELESSAVSGRRGGGGYHHGGGGFGGQQQLLLQQQQQQQSAAAAAMFAAAAGASAPWAGGGSLTSPPLPLQAPAAVLPLVGQPEFKAEIRVASSAIGAVLGKGGSTINKIRQMSGATVKVHQGAERDAPDRVVEIVGTTQQVSAAQSLIHACVVNAKQV